MRYRNLRSTLCWSIFVFLMASCNHNGAESLGDEGGQARAMATKAKADSVTSIASLHWEYPDSPSRTAAIYANGLNQVPVLLSASLLDENYNPVILQDYELLDYIRIFKNNGQEIPRETYLTEGQRGISYSQMKGPYVGAYRYLSRVNARDDQADEAGAGETSGDAGTVGDQRKMDPDESRLSVYLSTGEVGVYYNYYVALDLPQVSASTQGKELLQLTTLAPIIYSDPSKWQVTKLADLPQLRTTVGTEYHDPGVFTVSPFNLTYIGPEKNSFRTVSAQGVQNYWAHNVEAFFYSPITAFKGWPMSSSSYPKTFDQMTWATVNIDPSIPNTRQMGFKKGSSFGIEVFPMRKELTVNIPNDLSFYDNTDSTSPYIRIYRMNLSYTLSRSVSGSVTAEQNFVSFNNDAQILIRDIFGNYGQIKVKLFHDFTDPYVEWLY